jgi:hypothetical protein
MRFIMSIRLLLLLDRESVSGRILCFAVLYKRQGRRGVVVDINVSESNHRKNMNLYL